MARQGPLHSVQRTHMSYPVFGAGVDRIHSDGGSEDSPEVRQQAPGAPLHEQMSRRGHQHGLAGAGHLVIVGDGECQEGQVWEAAEIAAKYELDNLVVFVDNNGLQNDGACRDIMPTQDLRAKFEAFGWEAYRINGHCMEEIVWALDHIRGSNNGKPKAIVCNTVKGKGVSFMENVPIWHGLAPNDEQYRIAMEDLERGF